MSELRIERVESRSIQRWNDVAYGVALGTTARRELRQLAATHGEAEVLTPEQHAAIEKAVSEAQEQIIDKPVSIDGTPARLITRPEVVVEIYGRNLPKQGQFAYPKDSYAGRHNPISEKYPGSLGFVNYSNNY